MQKTPGRDNQVDVTLKVKEQNRNQITFGAGASQFEGFFGELSFQTTNFLSERQQFRLKDFRTSTGAEVRFFMPVLNVPFRLIFAANPQRASVLDDNFRPAKAFTFRFAVGSTF